MSATGRSVIRDPAMAIAAAKCWLASWMGGSKVSGLPPATSFHDQECAYCEFDRDGLIEAVEEFVVWSGISSDEEMPLRAEVEAFLTIGRESQSRQVQRQQGYR